ncbi:MAG: hypothetical protein H6505_03265 [Calditrichaeota bacterium]|nr:hypothetical protein [Calditrichota bacterium]
MKTCIWILIFMVAGAAFADNRGSLQSPLSVGSPQSELAELEARIASAKADGSPIDPAWEHRARELVQLLANHPGNLKSSSSASHGIPPLEETEFRGATVIRPQERTPLEQQIHDLEFQADGGFTGYPPDPVVMANLKEQLNELYAQRAENQSERTPLDQGADACPATEFIGMSFFDTGSTAGLANNFDPLIACGTSSAPDVIYRWIPPTSSVYTITTAGSSYDTYLHIRGSGSCPGTVQYACDDDGGPGLTSQITMRFYHFETYYIIVDGFSSNSGLYQLSGFEVCEIEPLNCDVAECAENLNDPLHHQNDCNGACYNGNGIPTWQNIGLCQTVCGKLFYYPNIDSAEFYDTDFYRFNLTEACSLEISLLSETVTAVYLLDLQCPTNTIYWDATWFYPCSTVTYITQCLPAGSYAIYFAPGGSYDNVSDYYFRVDPIPCSGCRVDAFIQAPGSGAWHTCGAGNNNSLRSSEDYTFCVNIPYLSDWTFSLCNDDSIWDSYLYLTTQCNGGVLATDDDGCGGVGLSTIDCVPLASGTYYLTVEAFGSGCGPFALTVTECSGRCCYGDPAAPSCVVTSPSACNELGGFFAPGADCIDACPAHYGCQGGSQVGQYPFLPGETGNGYLSHVDLEQVQSDNFSVGAPIGSLRFWGFPVTCNGTPETFQISLASETDTCSYTVTATGTQLPELFFGAFFASQYDVALAPPCEITSGNLSIAKVGNPECAWYWQSSNYGDTIHPSGAADDLAFCLGGSDCPAPDSVVIRRGGGGANAYNILFHLPVASYVRVYSSSDINAVFPATYTVLTASSLGAGNWTFTDSTPDAQRRYVLTAECGPPPVFSEGTGEFHRID